MQMTFIVSSTIMGGSSRASRILTSELEAIFRPVKGQCPYSSKVTGGPVGLGAGV